MPSRRKTVVFSAVGDPAGAFKASVEALNLDDVRFITAQKSAAENATNQNVDLMIV